MAVDIFGPKGILAQNIKGYQYRPTQRDLSLRIDQALSKGLKLLAEAPCGVGKSMAYLVPAARFVAGKEGRRVIVSTSTIALQEQLIRKDLPMLQAVSPWPFKFALVKGRSNYLCSTRLADAESEGRLRPDRLKPAATAQVDKLWAWQARTETGDVSELDFTIKSPVKQLVCGDTDECTLKQCKANNCFAYKARAKAEAANIVVCNYHVLFCDFLTGGALLPEFDSIICDEGHEIADIARDFFGFTLSRNAFMQIVNALESWNRPKLASELAHEIEGFFEDVEAYYRYTRKKRITALNFVTGDALVGKLLAAAAEFIAMLGRLTSEKDKKKLERRSERATQLAGHVRNTMLLAGDNMVYFLEKEETRNTFKVRGMPVELGPWLKPALFNRADSVVITSATLEFDYMRRELGVEEAGQVAVASPFDFSRQVLIVLPDMISKDPNENGFTAEVAELFKLIIDLAGGRTLGLFTSHEMKNAVYEHVRESLHHVLVQGEMPLTQLIETFKQDIDSVLIGTSSLWTGIDVPGEALSCLVMDRLPFANPDDPVMDFRKTRDSQWWTKWMLPKTIMDFKQGFGRLIRSQTDKGVAVFLDPRLRTKPYGKTILRSLPKCQVTTKLSDIPAFLGTKLTPKLDVGF